jgi:hypothetical protein
MTLLRWAAACGICAAVLVGTGGCWTLIGKGVSEARGGRPDKQEVKPLPAGPSLQRFGSADIQVERSADAGLMPPTLPPLVARTIKAKLDEAKAFPYGKPGGRLIIKVRLTTHWPEGGVTQVISAFSEILGVVEFHDGSLPGSAPMATYYVRGFSTAIARKADEDLASGFADGVVEIVTSHMPQPAQ